MAKGVTTCDFLKRQLAEDEECIEVTITYEKQEDIGEFTFSPEGFDALMSFLRGNTPLSTTAIQTAAMVEDLKTPPVATPEQVRQILEESKVDEEGCLQVMHDAKERKLAQQRLDEFNRRHETVQNKKAESTGSQHARYKF